MIFQYTIEKVLSGAKTQTRRLQHYNSSAFTDNGVIWQVYNTDKIRASTWTVGKTYAIQPGRGKKSVGRIQITGIRHEDVRNISEDDAKTEGFAYTTEFLSKWAEMHDGGFNFYFDPNIVDYRVWHDRRWDAVGYDTLLEILASRPSERYQAWVLEFKLVARFDCG